ncbi:MAG: hypothetical protein WC619_00815 [Patescibacteria group bacterium]
MTREKFLAGYREITVGMIEPSRTIHVFTGEGGDGANPGEFHLVKILAIANPAISDGEVKLHECKNGTLGKDILSLPVKIFTGEEPSADGFLFRIPK